MPSNPLLSAAQQYASLGWPVFPCRHDKSPYTANGFHDATTDLAQIEEWWTKYPGANIGFVPGEADLLALDYDPGHDRSQVERLIPDLPETGMVAGTPRGGTHEYYSLNKGDPPIASRTNGFAEHVDIRSFGGYVLLPPSATKEGKYNWTSRGKPALRSQGLLDACTVVREKDKDRDTWNIEPDLEENISLARAWLRGETAIGNSWCKPAVEHAGGDNATYGAAAMMKSCGLSEGTALELLWEEYNPRCDPFWDYDELATKVKNGYAYNTSPPGNVTPAYHVAKAAGLFSPLEERPMARGRQVTSGKFRFVDGPGLDAITPPDWLIPDSVPEDAYLMLVGPTGSYKTFLALDMALSIATGGGALKAGKWGGFWGTPRRTGSVLFAVGEGRSGLRQRPKAWMKYHWGHENVPEEFLLADPVPHVQDLSIETFVEGAKRLSGDNSYGLVVLDTVSRAMQGMNTNADENATSFTKLVDALRREFGCPVLAIGHTGHGNTDRARGSYAFQGDPDTIILTARHSDLMAKLTMAKQKDWEPWGNPHYCDLKLVQVEGGKATPAATATEAPKKLKGADMAGLALLDQYVVAFLKANSLEAYSDAKLSEGVSCFTDPEQDLEGCGMAAGTIRAKKGPYILDRLREATSGARSCKMYDLATRKWRYSALGDAEFSG